MIHRKLVDGTKACSQMNYCMMMRVTDSKDHELYTVGVLSRLRFKGRCCICWQYKAIMTVRLFNRLKV